MEYEIVPISQMPAPAKRNFSETCRKLKPGEAFWVSAKEGESFEHLTKRLGGNTTGLGVKAKTDRANNRIWFYKPEA